MRRLLLFFVSTGLIFSQMGLPLLASDLNAAHPLKFLLILPHPDDESMIRATLTRLIERGHEVDAVYLTRGEGGKDARKDKTPGDLGQIRAAEMESAAKAFGFNRLFQMTLPDVPLRDPVTRQPTRDPHFLLDPTGPWPLRDVEKKISPIAYELNPDAVITFFPGQKDTHAHHQATAELVKALYAAHALGPSVKNIYGFRENFATSPAELVSRLKLASRWLFFSPKKISPVTGLSYGQMGSKAELSHQSQLNDLTGPFIKKWDQEPDEAFASFVGGSGLSVLQEALGK